MTSPFIRVSKKARKKLLSEKKKRKLRSMSKVIETSTLREISFEGNFPSKYERDLKKILNEIKKLK